MFQGAVSLSMSADLSSPTLWQTLLEIIPDLKEFPVQQDTQPGWLTK